MSLAMRCGVLVLVFVKLKKDAICKYPLLQSLKSNGVVIPDPAPPTLEEFNQKSRQWKQLCFIGWISILFCGVLHLVG